MIVRKSFSRLSSFIVRWALMYETRPTRRVPVAGGLTVGGARSVLLRDSSLTPRLPDRLLSHHPAVCSVYTAFNSCDVSDRRTSVRRTPSNPQSFESNTDP